MRSAHHPGPNLATQARSAFALLVTGEHDKYQHVYVNMTVYSLDIQVHTFKVNWTHSLTFSSLSYNPYDGPNEHPEAELPLVAGKYLYVYGDMDDDGFYEGEITIYLSYVEVVK